MSTSLRRLTGPRATSTLAVGTLLMFGLHPASAAPYNWDPAQNHSASGGSGNWDTASSSWFNGTADVAWPNDTTADPALTAIFAGTAGTVSATGTINVNTITFNTSGYVITGGTGLSFGGTAPTISIGAGLSDTINSPITSGTGITIGGGGTLVATNTTANPLGTGSITVSGSTLQFGGTISFSNSFVINGTSTLSTTPSVTLNGNAATSLTGSGTLHLANVTSGGANQFTIGLPMSGFSGTVVLDGNTQLRLNNTSNFNLGSSGALFDLGSGSARLSNRNGAGLTYDLGGLQSSSTGTQLRGAQTGTTGNSASTYSIGALNTNTTYAGVIQDGSTTTAPPAPTNIVKVGTGSLTLSNGGSNYSGTTTVSNGNLVLTNIPATNASATGAGTVNVSGGAGAVLSGIGNTAGLVTVTAGSVLAPGVNGAGNVGNAGTLALGSGGTINISLVSGSPNNVTVTGGLTLTQATMDFDLSNSATGANDLLTTGGALTFGNETFNFNEMNGSLDTSPYTLISGAASFSNFNVNNITTTFAGGSGYTAAYTMNGNNLQVTFTQATPAAPEPSQFAAFGLGFLGLGGLTLRARRRVCT